MKQAKKAATKREPIKLTKAAVELVAVEKTAFFVAVVNAKNQAVQGLNLRVLPSGLKVWVHRYRFAGVQKSFTLGRWPAMTCSAAEDKSKAIQVEINAGRDPNLAKAEAKNAAVEKKRAASTLTDLAERYITEHIVHNKRSWADEATRLIRKHIIPDLGATVLKDVGPSDISTFLANKRKATPIQANRIRAVLRTMFQRAEEWELRTLGSNPVAVVKQRAPEVKRNRRLTDPELKALGATLVESHEPQAYLLAVRLALLAGMRKGEIQNLQWDWVDLKAREIRLPAIETEDNEWTHKTGGKEGRARVVYLCSALADELKALPRLDGCPNVIPGKIKEVNGKKVWGPFTALQNPWERIRVAAGLAVEDKPKNEDPGLHDLRRTFASVGADLGLKGFVGELLGHAEATVTDGYTRAAAETLHEAAEKIGGRIHGILTGKIDPEKEVKARRMEMEKRLKAEAKSGRLRAREKSPS